MFVKSIISTFALCVFFTCGVQAQEIMKLPIPNTTRGKPLMRAIAERKTERSFSNAEIDRQTLSEILYAAYGISHDNKHTIPTSMNAQALSVYILTSKGIFKYSPEYNGLGKISDKDSRFLVETQDYVKGAPLTIIYTGEDKVNSPMHAGSAYQNVGLYAASKGLNNVVRSGFDTEAVKQALKLKEDDNVIVSQTLGWPR